MKSIFSLLIVALVSGSGLACGGSAGEGTGGTPDAGPGKDAGGPPAMLDAGPPDAATTPGDAAMEAAPPVDHGAPSTTYPAFAPNFAQITNQGGQVMTNPVVVAITWDT